MALFFDLHNHMLCGVDDGASDQEEMYAMLEASYKDGTRAICLTPHYSPYLFGDTSASSEKAFALLKEYASRTHPDMQLFLANELGYHENCIQALESGTCRSIAGGRYVLVDFPATVDFFELRNAIDQLQRSGYLPVLAHAERYPCLHRQMVWIGRFVDAGGVIQVNASSVMGDWGGAARKQWIQLIRNGYAQVIASDGHNMTDRQPKMSVCMDFLQRHFPEDIICRLVWENAWRIVEDRPL